MSGPPKLVLLTPFGRAFALLPEHVLRTLLLESIAPIQSDGELLISLCYERVPREHATGEEFNHLYQLDDLTQGWTRQLVDELVDKILRRLPGPPEAADRTEAVQSLVHLLQMVPAGKSSWKYTANEVDYSIQDRANWVAWGTEPVVLPTPVAKWRHWKPSNIKDEQPITQRRLEQELRDKWAQKLVAHLAPFADKIPAMAAVKGANSEREYIDLLGDTRFRTLRIYCLGLENLHKLGFTSIPWLENDVRDLLNRLREQEVTPHKLQRIWDTLRWFSKKFGFLNVDECQRLQEKKKAIQEEMVDTISKPQRKAALPTKEVIWVLEEIASGTYRQDSSGSEGLPPVALMDQYICGITRFQVACSARFNDLQHCHPGLMKYTGGAIEGQAWQTKTVSAVKSKRTPVPLIAPTYSFTGRDWWTHLYSAWQKMKTLDNFKEADYLIPTVSKDYTGLIARPCTADRALRWLKAALHRHGGVPPELFNHLSWHSFRVFIPDCAYQLGFPRDQRQYIGNWTTESTADIYTREKRNVVERIWKEVADKSGFIRMDDPNKEVRIDLAHPDWDDAPVDLTDWELAEASSPSLGTPPCRRLFKGSGDDDSGGSSLFPDQPSRTASSPWHIFEDNSQDLRVVAATRQSRSTKTFTIHLLDKSGRAVGCGWDPPPTKALDLNPDDYIAEFDSYAKCTRCFKHHTFPTAWGSDGAEPEVHADCPSSPSSGTDTDDSVDTASDDEKVPGKILLSSCLPIGG